MPDSPKRKKSTPCWKNSADTRLTVKVRINPVRKRLNHSLKEQEIWPAAVYRSSNSRAINTVKKILTIHRDPKTKRRLRPRPLDRLRQTARLALRPRALQPRRVRQLHRAAGKSPRRHRHRPPLETRHRRRQQPQDWHRKRLQKIILVSRPHRRFLPVWART